MNNTNYISACDIAENAKLNHEIAEELRKYQSNHQLSYSGLTRVSRLNKESLATWIPVSSTGMTIKKGGTGITMIFCLTLFTLLPTLAKAEQCTPTPDCASLGYTETSCPDGGGVKCPWNINLMYCPQCETKNPCQSCYVGWILNSDMTCSTEKESGKTPIGVVANQTVTTNECKGFAVTLNNLDGQTTGDNAKYQSNNYNINGINNWHLPSQEELLIIHNNIEKIQSSLLKLGGTFIDDYYWSSSTHEHGYWYVNPISGKVFGINYGHILQVRPILAF